MVAGILLTVLFLCLGVWFNLWRSHTSRVEAALASIEANTMRSVEAGWRIAALLTPDPYVPPVEPEPFVLAGNEPVPGADSLQRGIDLLTAEYRTLGLPIDEAEAKRQVEAMIAGRNPFL